MNIQNDPHASPASAGALGEEGARQLTPEERIAFLREVFPEIRAEIARNPLFLQAIEKAEMRVLDAERRFRAELQMILSDDYEQRRRDQEVEYQLEDELELENIKRGSHSEVCPWCRRIGQDECTGWITSSGPPQQSVPVKDPHMPMAEPDTSRWYTKPNACKKLSVSGRELEQMTEAGWFFPHGEPMLMAAGFPRCRRPRGYLRARVYDPAQIDAFEEAAEKLKRGEYSKGKEWILLAEVASTRHSPKRLRRCRVGSSANVPAALISGPDWLTAVVRAEGDYGRYYEEAAEKLRQQGENGEMRDFVLWQTLQHARRRYQVRKEKSLLQEGFDRERAERMARGEVNQMLAVVIHRPDWIKAVAVETAIKCPDDEAYLRFAQEHVFDLGSYWRKRAQLAKYLAPQYEFVARLTKSPEDQLAVKRLRGELQLVEIHRVAEISSANHAALYVTQSIRDLHGVRHWTKLKPRFKLRGDFNVFDEGEDGETEVHRLTVGRDETGKRIRLDVPTSYLGEISETLVAYNREMSSMTAMGLAFFDGLTREGFERIGLAAGLTRKQSHFLEKWFRREVTKRDDEVSYKAIRANRSAIAEAMQKDPMWRWWDGGALGGIQK